ncbi:MAG TPA: hypothetical protein VFW23_08110 [Tepidisphaeraceae bacterium]|nr:hypothetical protein [Tepidisphaeraceae bacterium]
MKLQWIVGVCVVALLGSVVLARQGMVVTQDNQRYTGDVVEQATSVNIVQPDPKGGKRTVTINKGNIKDIVYADQVAEQVRKSVAKLDRRDANGRVSLAEFARDNGAYDVARDVLEEALKIEPDNKRAKDDLEFVDAQIRLQRGEKPLPPSSQASTETPTTRESTAEAPSSPMATRMVTPEEINRIRQLEWDKNQQLRITIDADARKRFLAGSDVTVAQFQQLSVQNQAIQILTNGKPDLWPGVHILTDPANVSDFKARIQKIVLAGCATGGCHGGPKHDGGTFYLFTSAPNANEMAYSNFLILQTYVQTVDKVQRPLVNRQFPERSLLLQYMLPQNVAEAPHPKTTNFRPLVRAKVDQRFQNTFAWIHELPSSLPDYGIDLTKEPEKKAPRR